MGLGGDGRCVGCSDWCLSLRASINGNMFANEAAFTDYVEQALGEAGYTTQREVPVGTGHRVDILTSKDDVKAGIEVKFQRRGLLDDLTKSHVLLRLPEVDEMYVCGPHVFMSDDVRALADQLGIGLLAIRDSGELEWLAPCRRLEPVRLGLGGNYPPVVEPGGEAVYNATVFNTGQKTAVDVEVRMVMAGPFAARYASKARARRALLGGQDKWSTTLVCNVKRAARPGKYPLLISVTAANAQRKDSTAEYEVRKASSSKP